MEKSLQKIGTFECLSGRLMISDPCYSRDTWCQGVLKDCEVGTWWAYVVRDDRERRISELHAHKGGVPEWALNKGRWELAGVENEFGALEELNVGVDSGQCGIYDDSAFPDDTGDYGGDDEPPSEYRKICEAVNGPDDSFGPGVAIVLDGRGVCSQSGYGDGGYNVYVSGDRETGLINSVKIVFIGDENEEDEDA